jgi:glutamate racemase
LSSAKRSKSAERAIGVFDSGVGGLTVVRALRKLLPQEEIVYLGDLARLPYGDKSAETVRRYALDCFHFLERQDVKMVVIACNTATAWAIDLLQAHSELPIVGVVQPAVDATLKAAPSKVGVIATRGTINSGVFQQKLHPLPLQAIPCPLFVSLIEEGLTDHQATELMIRHYLGSLDQVDTLLLGCTHYPLLAPTISRLMGPSIRLIDPATSCAETVAAELQKTDLLANGTGQVDLHFTDRPPHLERLVEAFLGEQVSFKLATL